MECSLPLTLQSSGLRLERPSNHGWVLTRITAKVSVQNKLDEKLYTREEVKVLSDVDSGLVAKVAKGRRNELVIARVVTC